MAVTAATASTAVVPLFDGKHIVTGTVVTGDSSYLNGGEPLTAAQLGLDTVAFALVAVTTAAGAVVRGTYNIAAATIQWFTASAEVANAVDLSTLVCTVVAWGPQLVHPNATINTRDGALANRLTRDNIVAP